MLGMVQKLPLGWLVMGGRDFVQKFQGAADFVQIFQGVGRRLGKNLEKMAVAKIGGRNWQNKNPKILKIIFSKIMQKIVVIVGGNWWGRKSQEIFFPQILKDA